MSGYGFIRLDRLLSGSNPVYRACRVRKVSNFLVLRSTIVWFLIAGSSAARHGASGGDTEPRADGWLKASDPPLMDCIDTGGMVQLTAHGKVCILDGVNSHGYSTGGGTP